MVTHKQLGDMLRQPPLTWTLNDAMWEDYFVFNRTTKKKKKLNEMNMQFVFYRIQLYNPLFT